MDEINRLSQVVKTDSTLFAYLKDELILSLRQTNEMIRDGLLLINGKAAKGNMKLKSGDEITLVFRDEPNEYEPWEYPPDILYESADLLIVNKPAGLLVHPTGSVLDQTLANAVTHYYKSKQLKRKIRFVNRLDRDTSGLLIIAKNSYSHQFLAKQFEHETEKIYLALVSGTPEPKNEEITGQIEKQAEKYVLSDEGKTSTTVYRVLQEYPGYSLAECILKTGRTHQIRVHLASIGTPILGDTLYGTHSPLINRQALHAYSFSFKEPRTFLPKTVVCELPQDMKKLV